MAVMARPYGPGSREPSPSVSAASGFDPSRIMPAIRALEASCAAAVMGAIPEGHVCGVIHATKEQWDAQETAFGAREQFFAAMMPTERDAIDIMHAAFTRLKGMDWSDPIYCPKDGSSFDMIEAGSTGIHHGHYSGEWPNGSWWIEDDGDLCPSRPVLYRRTEAEKAKWAKFREAASGMSAGTAETAQQAQGEARQPGPKGDAQVLNAAADLQPSQVDSHNHGPDSTSDRTDITGGSFEGATK